MLSFAAKLDALPAPIWIGLAILGLVIWWPLGLVLAAYALWSGKMSCCGMGFGRWSAAMSQRAPGWSQGSGTSGNQAFDEYRAATLRRLEEEQRDFGEFLSRLRMAKDKAEFDQFMAERRDRSGPAQG